MLGSRKTVWSEVRARVGRQVWGDIGRICADRGENLWDREQGSVGRILFGTQGDITRWTRTMYRHTIFRAILMLHNMIYFIVMLTKLAQIIDVNNRAPLFTVQRPRTHYSPCSILNKYSTSQVSPHPWYHNKIRRATLSSCVTSTTVKPYLIVAKLT